MFSVRSHALLILLLAAGLCGCTGRPAAVGGKVTFDGKPVTAGTLGLTPVPIEDNPLSGNPGSADIRPDGSFAMEVEPGANGLPHRYTVRFTPPPVKVTAATARDVVLPYVGLIPKQAEVEIQPGVNVIDIELIPVPVK